MYHWKTVFHVKRDQKKKKIVKNKTKIRKYHCFCACQCACVCVCGCGSLEAKIITRLWTQSNVNYILCWMVENMARSIVLVVLAVIFYSAIINSVVAVGGEFSQKNFICMPCIKPTTQVHRHEYIQITRVYPHHMIHLSIIKFRYLSKYNLRLKWIDICFALKSPLVSYYKLI